MKKVQIFNTYTAPKKEGEVNKGKSLTVPSKSLTVKQIFERYSSGNLDVKRRQEIYLDDDENDFDAIDMEKFGNMDLVDREILRNAGRQTLETVETYLQKQKTQKEDKKSDKADTDKQSADTDKQSDESPKTE